MYQKNLKLIISFLVLVNWFPAYSQWIWKNPLPQGNHLNAAWFINPSTGYMAGEVGTIMKTTDGGITWDINNFIEYSIYNNFNSISFANDSYGYAASHGYIYKTSNAGSDWYKVYYEEDEAITDVIAIDSLTAIAVCTYGKILKTIDGGIVWQSQIYPTEESFSSISFPVSDTGYISSYDGSILKTIDKGNTWSTIFYDSTEMYEVNFSDPSHGWALGFPEKVYKTTDGGITWAVTCFDDTVHVKDIGLFNNDNLLILTEVSADWPPYLQLMKSSDGGNSWIYITLPEDFTINDIYCTAEGTAYCVGYFGFIARSDDFGLTWTKLSTILTEINHFGAYTRDIDFPTSETGYAVAGGHEMPKGSIIKTIDGGDSWFQLDSIFYLINFNSCKFLNADTGFIAGTNIYSTYDGGNSWLMEYAGSYANMISSIDFANATTGVAVGSNGTFIRTTNRGDNWEQINTVPLVDYYHVSFWSDSTGYATSANLLLKTNDAGMTWLEIPLYFTLYQICFTSEQTGYGVANPGGVMKTTDGGFTWTLLPQPTDKPLFTLDFYDQDTGFIAGGTVLINSVIFKTTDGGQSWEEQVIPTIYPIMNICVNSDYKVFASNFLGGLISNPTPGTITKSRILPVSSSLANFKTFPNPASESINVEYNLSEEEYVTIKLYSITGSELQTVTDKKRVPGIYQEAINITGLNPGIYILHIKHGNHSEARKIVVL